MSWPWVPRAVYDDAIRTVASMREREVLITSRYDALMEKYHALKLAGAVPEAKPVEVVPVPARQEDEAKLLISEMCGTDYRKRAMMLKGLASDRAAGRNEQSILREIVKGIQPNGVPA